MHGMYGFKEFDVRGNWEEVNEVIAERIGQYFPEINKSKEIMVGFDHRRTSEELYKFLVKGLKSRGIEVYNIGLCTTPMFYYAVAKHNFKAGIMITASHSPKNQNGFKFVKKKAQPIYIKNGLKELEHLVMTIPHMPSKKGKINTLRNVPEQYHRDILEMFPELTESKKKLKIVVDPGNGVGILDLDLLKKVADVKVINGTLNPNFPGRGPNPILHGVLEKLSKKVKDEKANLGVAFDGDADRVVFVDNLGKVILADNSMALFSDKLTKKGDKLVYDLRLSKVIEENAKKRKVEVIKSPVGHSIVANLMKKVDGNLGAEYSGHYYFKEINYTDSGLFATLSMLKILTKEKKKLSILLKKYQKYVLSEEINMELENRDKIKIFEKEKNIVSHLDGISIKDKDVWYNVRKSKTEPVVRIRAEAKTKTILNKKIKEIEKKLDGKIVK